MIQHGTTAIRFLKSLAISRGDPVAAGAYANSRDDWIDSHTVSIALKSGIGGLEQATGGGAGYVAADFLSALRPMTIYGRLPLRRVPALMPLLTQLTGSTARWVGEGAARVMVAGQFDRSPGLVLKQVGAVTVASDELLDDPSVDSENVVLADLLAANVEAVDRAFLDPNNSGDANTPASITSTATPIASSGGAVEDLDYDLKVAIAELVAAGSNLRQAYWVMSSSFAARLSLTRGTSGAPAYPLIGALGGSLAGLPVLTSQAAYEASSDQSENIALIDAAQIRFAEGEPVLKISRNAMLEMDSTPTGRTTVPTGASQNFVSMFQSSCAALLGQISVNWTQARAGMTQIITGIVLDDPA